MEGARRGQGGVQRERLRRRKTKDLEPEEPESGEISRRGDTTQSLRGAASPASQPLLFTSTGLPRTEAWRERPAGAGQ